MFVKTVVYHALNPGIALAIMGAIHGNETCGTAAIHRLMQEIDTGHVALKQGQLNLMPIANPAAYQQGMRYVERNLNRSLYPKTFKKHYEDYLDPIVCDFLDQADALLDLHSYSSSGKPFIFLDDPSDQEVRFAAALGIENVVYGWTQAFGNQDDKEAQGTTEYARLRNIPAITLECGQHDDVNAPEVGYQAILKSLKHFDMLEDNCPAALALKAQAQALPTPLACIKMQTVFYRQPNVHLAKDWQHLDSISKNDVMVYLENNQTLIAPEDGYILLPKRNASVGDEWFYFGTCAALNFSNN